MVPKFLGGWGLKNIFLFAKALATKGGWRLIHLESIWMQVIIHKYLAPKMVEEWIRNPKKTHAGGSVIWKAVVKSFNLIGPNLAWNVGNGRCVWIGVDPWVGCTQKHILPAHTVASLRERNIIYLHQLAILGLQDIWVRSWRQASFLDLDEQDGGELACYIGELNRSLLQLRDREDELIWDVDPCGRYTPKSGYLKLSADGILREPV